MAGEGDGDGAVAVELEAGVPAWAVVVTVVVTAIAAPGALEVVDVDVVAAVVVVAGAAGEAAAPSGPEDVCLLLYSAGSGPGELRAVPQSTRTVQAANDSFAKELLQLSSADRILSVARLSTAYGLGGLFFPLAVQAESLLFPAQPHSRALFEALRTYKPTVLFAIPSVYAQLAHDAVGVLVGEHPEHDRVLVEVEVLAQRRRERRRAVRIVGRVDEHRRLDAHELQATGRGDLAEALGHDILIERDRAVSEERLDGRDRDRGVLGLVGAVEGYEELLVRRAQTAQTEHLPADGRRGAEHAEVDVLLQHRGADLGGVRLGPPVPPPERVHRDTPLDGHGDGRGERQHVHHHGGRDVAEHLGPGKAPLQAYVERPLEVLRPAHAATRRG